MSTTPIYPRKPDGTINWRALVKPEHLYVKKEHEAAVVKKAGKPLAEIPITEIEDRYLVIRLAGILELARLRGYSSARPEVKHVQRDYVVVQTWIDWLPWNDEAVGQTSGGVGEATPENTTPMGRAYLAATAENRAFSRAVRRFLEIDIVSHDELGEKGQEPESDSATVPLSGQPTPQGILAKTAEELKTTFELVKKGAIGKWKADTEAKAKDPAHKMTIENDPNTWTKFDDVAPRDCMTVISLLRGAAAKAKAEADKKAAK